MFNLIVEQDGCKWSAATCGTRDEANILGIYLALIYERVEIIHDKEVKE